MRFFLRKISKNAGNGILTIAAQNFKAKQLLGFVGRP
jgi:hypothetical protein